MNKMLAIIFSILLVNLITACNVSNMQAPSPKSRHEREEEKYGKVTNEGFVFGQGSNQKKQEISGITVNSYLWRASLDVINFMPIASVDPFGGVIITDWYEDPNAIGTKFKLNVIINSAYLRADAVKVSAFKQVFKNNRWYNQTVDVNFTNIIEEKILSQARALKIASKE